MSQTAASWQDRQIQAEKENEIRCIVYEINGDERKWTDKGKEKLSEDTTRTKTVNRGDNKTDSDRAEIEHK